MCPAREAIARRVQLRNDAAMQCGIQLDTPTSERIPWKAAGAPGTTSRCCRASSEEKLRLIAEATPCFMRNCPNLPAGCRRVPCPFLSFLPLRTQSQAMLQHQAGSIELQGVAR